MEYLALETKPQWVIHLFFLLKKNYLLIKRAQRSTIVQFLAPFFFIFCLWIIQKGVETRFNGSGFYDSLKNPDPQTINPIPLCIVGPDHDSCYNFIYTFNSDPLVNETIQNVIKQICDNNSPQIPLDSVRGFETEQEVDNWLSKNENMTQAAYLFDNATMSNFSYVIQVNETNQYVHGVQVDRVQYIYLPLQWAVEKELFKILTNDPSAELEVLYSEFAHPQVIVINVIGEQSGMFILAASIFNLIVALGQIITEKEGKIRQTMHQMGLENWVYWLSWTITHCLINTVCVIILIISGLIFQFDVFLVNNFFVYFFLLWEFAMTMVPITFVASTLIRESKHVTVGGFLVFLLCFVIQITIASLFIADVMTESLATLFSFFPPALLSKGLYDLGRFSDEDDDTGLSWASRNDYENARMDGTTDIMTVGSALVWLFFDFWIYLLIALYLDNVLPNAYGVRKPYLYFLKSSYWTGKSSPISNTDLTQTYHPRPETDEDVEQEEREIMTDPNPKEMKSKDGENLAVVIRNLRREFEAVEGSGKKAPKAFVAVDDLSLRFYEKQLFCLLGHNGAGKTTTIHMLTGLLPPTSGDAFVEGMSILDNMDEIGKVMGVCPQFDVLWPDLTGREHLEIFASIKGTEYRNLEHEIQTRLKEVELLEAQSVRTRYYSGGMKRRLSVSISFIGNPKVVYLDEPTTGMDPISRRQVWNIIQEAKKDKTMILTTHSMEEADVLADTIGIMGKGRLRCLGTPLRLKNKFGAGYQIVIQTSDSKESIQRIVEFVKSQIPEIMVESVIFGFVSFSLNQTFVAQMKVLFRALEAHRKQLDILDIQLSLTTLEEVFLQISHLLAQEEEENEDVENVFDSQLPSENKLSVQSEPL